MTRTSADYQRDFRERMRKLGLVKKDVWIRPEYAAELSAIEKRMREPRGDASVRADGEHGFSTGWSIHSLHAALAEISPVRSGAIELEWMDGLEPSLHLVMHEYGELPIFVAVGGEQLIVEALMWPVDEVADTAAFNDHVLRTHKVLPLTTVGIEVISDVPCYTMFGSLDTHSSLANIVFEIETLAANVISVTDAYAEFLRPEARVGLGEPA
ncbi:YjfI family protein [Lysobacter korlensis]|uniref:YjfI family protein n=1 Tax=Lysobacter korlensis TaxID=553636 RepID=A0ABV6RRZ7_9GAMM